MSRVMEIELIHVGLPLKHPFRTSFGVSTAKECILARLRTDAAEGWGECVADDGHPGFSGEWIGGSWPLLRDVLAPALIRAEDLTIDRVEITTGIALGDTLIIGSARGLQPGTRVRPSAAAERAGSN